MYRIFLTCSLMVAMTMNASAYLDPSVMTYTIQVVAGGVGAVGAGVGVFWREAKKKVQDSLGMGEDAKENVEEAVVELEDSEEKEGSATRKNGQKKRNELVEIREREIKRRRYVAQSTCRSARRLGRK